MQEDIKEVSEELEGKTQEELSAMEEEARAELQKRIYTDACTYVFNVLDLGKEYSEEEYSKALKELQDKHNTEEGIEELKALYSNLSDEEYALNQNILAQGYGNFGKRFIEATIEKDPESAKVLFEAAIQSWLDLKYQVDTFTTYMQTVGLGKEEKEKENNEESN